MFGVAEAGADLLLAPGLTPALNEVLAVLPTDVTVHEADDDALATVASLYAVLDEVPKRPQVGMAKLSKVLARKRPSFIPIYDEAVRECYTDCAGAPAPPQDDRSREGYALGAAAGARRDLAGQLPAWEDLAALAPADRVAIGHLGGRHLAENACLARTIQLDRTRLSRHRFL